MSMARLNAYEDWRIRRLCEELWRPGNTALDQMKWGRRKGGPAQLLGRGSFRSEINAPTGIDQIEVIQVDRDAGLRRVYQAEARIEMLVGDVEVHGSGRKLLIGSDEPHVHVGIRNLSLKRNAREGVGWEKHIRCHSQGSGLAARYTATVNSAAARRKARIEFGKTAPKN